MTTTPSPTPPSRLPGADERPPTGALLDDRYELGEVIGAGGMGTVHRAVDTRLGRTVAVKIMGTGAVPDEAARARMRREANLAASIHHPGVAQVFDMDEDDAEGVRRTFIVMQLVEGQSLAQHLRESGPMPPDQVMSVVAQVAEGLQAAHEAGVVHRDLKPANIMITPAGRTVLVDFGIARSATSDPLTQTGTLVGTADYMSPEQAAGRTATPQSDLYALGVVAHHCLTGTSPFRRDSPVATALAHLQDAPPELPAGVPGPVADLLATLTAKEPNARPTTAAAVALQAAAIGTSGTIEMVPVTSELATGPATLAVEPPRHVDPPRRSRRPLLLLALIAVLLGLGVLAFQQLSGGDPTPVPDVVGLQQDVAETRLDEAGMATRTTSVDVAGATAGQVVKQSPEAGAAASDDQVITLSVASGSVMVVADDIVGLDYDEASAALEKLGLRVERDEVVQSGNTGEVVSLDASGRVEIGSTVTLTVATAPAAATTTTPEPAADTPAEPAAGGPGGAKGKGTDKPKDKKK